MGDILAACEAVRFSCSRFILIIAFFVKKIYDMKV